MFLRHAQMPRVHMIRPIAIQSLTDKLTNYSGNKVPKRTIQSLPTQFKVIQPQMPKHSPSNHQSWTGYSQQEALVHHNLHDYLETYTQGNFVQASHTNQVASITNRHLRNHHLDEVQIVLHQTIYLLVEQLQEIQQSLTQGRLSYLATTIESLFTIEIMTIVLSGTFMFPNTGTYDSIKDLMEHLESFKGWMDLYTYTDTIRCRAFQLTLSDKARAWYHKLKPNKINSLPKF